MTALRLPLVLLLALCVVDCAMLTPRYGEARLEWLDRSGDEAYRSGDYRKARSRWEQGREVASAHGNDLAEVGFLVDLARLEEIAGHYEQAVIWALEGLQIAQALNDAKLTATAHSVSGLAYRRMSDYAKAQSHSEKALAISRQIGDLGLASESMRNLGAIHQAKGDYEEALSHYREALELAHSGTDTARESDVLSNIGGIQRLKGSYQEALRYYNDALALKQKLGDRPGQVKVLGNICLVYQNLNDTERALDYCKRSLDMAHAIGDRAREANNLNNIATIYRKRGELHKALEHYRRSLSIKREILDRAGSARTLNNIGELYLMRGEFDEALAYFAESLQIQDEIGDRAVESAAHYNLGLIHHWRDEHDRALDHFEKALIIQLEVGERNLLWRIYDDLSRVHAALDRPRVAIFFGKLAVNTLQSIRGEIQELDKALQRSYLTDKLRAYKHLAGLLIDQGRLPEAQRVLDMLKEEEYVDFVVRSSASADRADTRSSFRSDAEPFAGQIQAFEENQVKMTQEYEKLRAEQARLFLQGKDLSEEKKERFNELKQEIKLAGQALRDLLTLLVSELSMTQQISEVDEKTLEYLFNQQGTLRDVSDRVNAVMLQYLVTPDRLYMILTTPLTQVARLKAVPATELNNRIQDLRTALLSPQESVREPAAALYELLIRPIAKDLKQADAELLWVSMDGALRYIPLAVLYDRESDRWLGQDYAVAMLTEATKASWKDRPSQDWKVAGLGLSREVEGYSRLPAVVEELEGIVRREDEQDLDGVLPGIIRFDDDFTANTLETVLDLQLFPVIHIASHFVLPEGSNVQNAFLVLGNGERLYLNKFLEYRFDEVELLTLSACNTAVGEQARDADSERKTEAEGEGSDNGSGREVEGLAALVQIRGASSVLATLWEVADAATATFMQRFYRLRTEGMSKAEALQAAQLSFIDEGRAPDSAEKTAGRGVVEYYGETRELSPYSHPYFWAPFILTGNWL